MGKIVGDNQGNIVIYKVVTDPRGDVVLTPNGSLMLAPNYYDPSALAAAIKNSWWGKENFAYGFADLQRNYNIDTGGNYSTNGVLSTTLEDLFGKNSIGFVGDFTPVASWALGYTAAANGQSLEWTLAGGGIFNKAFGHKPTGIWWNNPNNVPNIERGYWDYYKSLDTPSEWSSYIAPTNDSTNTELNQLTHQNPSKNTVTNGASDVSKNAPHSTTDVYGPTDPYAVQTVAGGKSDLIGAPGSSNDWINGFGTNGISVGDGGNFSIYANVSSFDQSFSGFGTTPFNPPSYASFNFDPAFYPTNSLDTPYVEPSLVFPIILDLTGTGVNITELSRSNTFLDSDGTGLSHRTAWAGSGSGVLFFDPNGTGLITQKNQYVFTEWDPTAKTDLQALRDVFDSNGDGVFDASDAKWGLFKVMVTKDDGTQTAKTFAQLGITSINLKADLTHVTYADGSEINGQASFTMGGNTFKLANTTLAADATGYAVNTSISIRSGSYNPVTHIYTEGATTKISTGTKADGSVAFVETSVTSETGNSITTSYDDNGDGVIDRVQAIRKSVDLAGIKTETLSNKNGGGVLIDRLQTITSADGKTVTLNRDTTGGGWFNQSEVRTTFADGHRTIIITNLNADGSEITSTTTAVSIDGLTRTVSSDFDSNNLADRISNDVVVNNTDLSRTETITETGSNGTSLLDKTVINTSTNGRIVVSTFDLDGNTTIDKTVSSTIIINADSSSNSVTNVTNADSSLRSSVSVLKSIDGLTSTIASDINGDGITDSKTIDAMVINADASRDHTVSQYNPDGTLQSRVITHLAADHISKTVSIDRNGDGFNETTETVSIDVAGIKTDITSNYAVSVGAQGVLINRSTVTTSADGLSVSTATDINGDGINDKTVNDVTVKNADGTSTRTISSQARDGSLYNQVQQIITANGLQVTTKTDIDGVNGFDQTKTDLREVFADLSTRHTVTLANANGTTHSQTIENATVDRRSVSRTVDNNGDGFVDQTQTVVKATNGITTSTTTDKAKNGTTIDQTILITSANGLSITTKHDFDGNATIDKFKTDVTTYGLDGSTTETIENHNNDATLSLIDRTTLQISGNGLSQTAKSDYNGDGTFDLTVSDVKVLNANGSITETVANKNSLGTTTSQQTVTTSASGLSIITTQDINGDNTTDLTSNDITFLNANGSNSHLVSVLNSNGTLRSKSITITDVDAHLTVTNTDVNGDGKYDQTETITKWGSGNINDLTINRDIYGVTQSGTLVNSTANGLSKVTYHDYSGLGKFYDHVDNVTVINADGSRTNTISDYEINYSTFGDYLTHKEVVNTSASGLSITTNTYTLGLATPDRVRTDVTAIAADGSQIETVIDSFLVGGTHTIDKTTIAISADQLTKTITKNFPDANQVETVAIGVDGRTVDDTVTRTLSGVLISEFTTVTSANGLQSTHYDFRSGGTAYDLATTKSTVLNVDGSRTTTVQDLVGNNIIRDQSTTQISANGLIKLIKEDRNGDGVFERLTSDTTVLNTDGSRTQTISVTSNTNAPLDKLVSLKSANGLSTSEQTDFDGNGTYEHSVVYSRAADSSTTETTTLKKLSGATYEIDLQTLSANGLVSTLKQDLDGNGTYDRVRTVTTDLSGNSIIELKDQNSVGATIEKITIQVAENGLSNSASIDFNGDGIADITKIYNKNFSSFGGQTYEYTASSIGNGQFYNTQLTTIDPGGYHWSRVVNFFRDTISNSPGDPSDETVDSQRVIQTDGWDVTTITTKDSSTNALINKTTTQIQTTGFETLILIDNNGDGVLDRAFDDVKSLDGKHVVYNYELTTGGTITSERVETTSADGLIISATYYSGGVYVNFGTGATNLFNDVTQYLPNSMGSYSWTKTQTGVSGNLELSTHTFDATGVDSWSLIESGTTYSTKLIKAAEANFETIASRIFDTLLDRDMFTQEKETLVKYITDANLNRSTLVTAILTSTEFTTKYGALTNAEFISQIYQNALGRLPTLAEVQTNLTGLVSGTITKASLAISVSESAEHLFAGLDHILTNNTNLNLGGLNVTHGIDHVYDSAKESNFVKQLFDTLVDRDPTSAELSTDIAALLNGTKSKAQMAIDLYNSAFVALHGNQTNAGYVDWLIQNTFSKYAYTNNALVVAHSPTWVTMLDNGSITRADLALIWAESYDHQLATNIHGVGQIDVTSTATNIAYVGFKLNFSAGVGGTASGANTNANLISNSNIVMTATGDSANIHGIGNTLAVNSGVINIDGGAQLNLSGTGNTLNGVNTVTGHGAIVNLTSGSLLSVNISDSEIAMGANTSATISGHRNLIDMSAGVILNVTDSQNSTTVSYAASTASVTINIATQTFSGGFAQGNVISGVHAYIGSAFDDLFVGDSYSNTFSGGAGNDTFYGGNGVDRIDGGVGVNTVNYASSTSSVSVNFQTGLGAGGNAEGDSLINVQNIVASAFNDTIIGDANNNTLTGGAGNDTLTGGAGIDTFVYTPAFGFDTITDFTAGAGTTHDVLQLSLGAQFSSLAQVIAAATQVGANTLITIDANDTITLNNVTKTALVASNFVFV